MNKKLNDVEGKDNLNMSVTGIKFGKPKESPKNPNNSHHWYQSADMDALTQDCCQNSSLL